MIFNESQREGKKAWHAPTMGATGGSYSPATPPMLGRMSNSENRSSGSDASLGSFPFRGGGGGLAAGLSRAL